MHIPYRTTEAEPSFSNLTDSCCNCLPTGSPFPDALDPFTCNRYEIAEYTKRAADLGVQFFGLCCGNAPHLTRAMAEALGKTPPASKYSPDMSQHFKFTDVRR